MLCGVCLTEEDVVEPAVLDGRRQSLPGNGTGFLDMNDESYRFIQVLVVPTTTGTVCVCESQIVTVGES